MPKIIITFGEGPTQIEGPIDQKGMCYHAILDAVLALIEYQPKQILPVGVLPFDPTKGGGKSGIPGGMGGRG